MSEIKKPLPSSAMLVRLARHMGIRQQDLVARLDPDIVRRTKYSNQEEILPDGRIVYHDRPQITEGPIRK